MKPEYDRESLVDVAMLIASTVLKSGGETYRADECLKRILLAHGANDVQIFSTPTGVTISAYFEEKVISRTASVSNREVDLSCLDECLSASRDLTEGKITIAEARERVEKERDRKLNIPYTALTSALCGAFFALIAGGGLYEFIASAASGFLGMMFYYWLDKRSVSFFITNLGASVIMALGAKLFCSIFPTCNMDIAIVGSIIPLVPGLITLNALRDSFNGDIVSTGARLAEAVIVAVSIAGGVAVSFLI